MEDSFEIIIYIIAIVVALVSSVVRAQNKKKQRETQVPPGKNIFFPELETESYETYCEEEMSDEADNETESQVVFDIIEEDTERKNTDTESTKKKEYIEGEAIFQETRDALLSDEISDNISISELLSDRNEKEGDGGLTEEEEIDWQKAVIHMEILNRKEF
jgi:hypothetical protein